MRITETVTYHAPVEVVYAMKTNPEFQELKCADSGALQHKVAVRQNGAGASGEVGLGPNSPARRVDAGRATQLEVQRQVAEWPVRLGAERYRTFQTGEQEPRQIYIACDRGAAQGHLTL